ncbi:MAG TPA: hypothetical protein VJ756_08320 [Terriglobales bacterium]|nr:hypothetical protein [Terriglobales bacterium]
MLERIFVCSRVVGLLLFLSMCSATSFADSALLQVGFIAADVGGGPCADCELAVAVQNTTGNGLSAIPFLSSITRSDFLDATFTAIDGDTKSFGTIAPGGQEFLEFLSNQSFGEFGSAGFFSATLSTATFTLADGRFFNASTLHISAFTEIGTLGNAIVVAGTIPAPATLPLVGAGLLVMGFCVQKGRQKA